MSVKEYIQWTFDKQLSFCETPVNKQIDGKECLNVRNRVSRSNILKLDRNVPEARYPRITSFSVMSRSAG